jgi:hypothetical protein
MAKRRGPDTWSKIDTMGQPIPAVVPPSIDQNKLGAHIYVGYTPDGVENMMWIREDSDLDWHLKYYGLDQEHVHITQNGKVYNSDGLAWPKDHPVKLEDVPMHKIVNPKNSGKNEDNELQMCPIRSKEYCSNKLRDDRDMMFRDLDVQYMRALETGQDTSQILRTKRILRDMPTHQIWSECNTLDDFKNVKLEHVLNHPSNAVKYT